jgi:acyl-CoA thioesterase II
MGELAGDTAVERDGDRFRGHLSPDWEIWGPNGGYTAAVALRAALAASRFDRPASISCHFLSGARFGPVELGVEVLRGAKRAESLRVTMRQDDRTTLEALVWTVADTQGLEHDHAEVPSVPAPDDLLPIEELTTDPRATRYSFFENLDERPIDFPEDGRRVEGGTPRVLAWFRFRPVATFEDPAVDACRSLILSDTMEWPAAVRAYAGDVPWVAPSLDLSVRFHRFEPYADWLLTDTTALVATDGLIGGAATIWSPSGHLLATAAEQMLCRPV